MLVALLQGSVRSERMGDRVAKWVTSQLESRGHEVFLVDTAVLQLPLLNKMWKELKGSSDTQDQELISKLRPIAERYEQVDGFIVVSAEYNHSIPPALSNLIDYFLEEYFYRPSAIVCYSAGGYGGVRAAMQLRSLLAEAGMSSIPSLKAIPDVGISLSAEGVALTMQLAENSAAFFDEFDWYMDALRTGRQTNDPRKPRV
jgi:NAD(P)H-dependent FMN reductase